MKKRKVIMILALIIVIIVICLIAISTQKKEISISEQIKNIKPIYTIDYSNMGDSYIDAIYEKYDTVRFGTQSDNPLGVLKKPLEWIVLDKNENAALLLSKYIIDCKPFDYVDIENIDMIDEQVKERYKYCDWGESSLRKWLNSDLLNNAFSKEEKEKVLLTYLNDVNTNDRIFCVSEEEYKRYFDNGQYYEQGRDLGEHHIYYNGATRRNEKAQSYDKYGLLQPNETYDYWLRDKSLNISEQGVEFGSTKTIGLYGEINSSINIDPYCGVRPALWVSLD